MPRLVREESQEVTAAAPPPPKQQTATVQTTLTTKNEKRKQSHPVQQHDGKQSSSTPNKRTKTQKKKKKDPNEPKRPRSAYNFYAMDARPKIVATGVTDVGTVNSQLGEQWKSLSAMDKLPYEQMNLDDKKRYAEEKAAYDAKNESVAESAKQVGGGTTVPLAYSGNMMGDQKSNTLTYTNGGVDNASDVKQESDDEVIEVLETKKEVNVAENNGVPPSSQKSPESVVVDLLVEDPKEKNDSLRKEGDNAATNNNGNKENNNAPISKVGKGLKGLGKSLASSAKSGVTRLFSKNKNQEENSSKPTTAVRADVRKSDDSKDSLSETRADSGGSVSGRDKSGEKDGEDQKVSKTLIFTSLLSLTVSNLVCPLFILYLQLPVEMKLKDDAIVENQKQAILNQATAPNDDKDDGTASQQSADLLSECCEEDGTPLASNTSNKSPEKTKTEVTSSDPPQAPAHLARLTIVPLNRDDCASALKKLKGCACEQPDYLPLVPEKDQAIVRETITLEEKDDANSRATSLEEVTLGRSSVTGIRSTLISRQLCTLEMKGESASITMLKASDNHAVFLNGEPLEGPASTKYVLNDFDILSLFGPVDFAYRIQLSSYVH